MSVDDVCAWLLCGYLWKTVTFQRCIPLISRISFERQHRPVTYASNSDILISSTCLLLLGLKDFCESWSSVFRCSVKLQNTGFTLQLISIFNQTPTEITPDDTTRIFIKTPQSPRGHYTAVRSEEYLSYSSQGAAVKLIELCFNMMQCLLPAATSACTHIVISK